MILVHHAKNAPQRRERTDLFSKKIPREFLGISREQQFESLNVNDPQDDLLC